MVSLISNLHICKLSALYERVLQRILRGWMLRFRETEKGMHDKRKPGRATYSYLQFYRLCSSYALPYLGPISRNYTTTQFCQSWYSSNFYNTQLLLVSPILKMDSQDVWLSYYKIFTEYFFNQTWTSKNSQKHIFDKPVLVSKESFLSSFASLALEKREEKDLFSIRLWR